MGKRKDEVLLTARPKGSIGLAAAMLAAARQVAADVGVNCVLTFADGLAGLAAARTLVRDGFRVILAVRSHEQAEQIRGEKFDVLLMPLARLSRIDQVKTAVLCAFTQGLLKAGDQFIALVGLVGNPVDSLMVISAGQAVEIINASDPPLLNQDIRPDVFQRIVHVAIALAAEGREGKPVGILVVLGDTDCVLAHASQLILNPFHGYPPERRDIMDDDLLETFREFAILDGAFVIRGDGQIETAGAYLRPAVAGERLPPGLGARHAAAADITATAGCLAITISESTGAVRVWRKGRVVTEIKRAAGLLPNVRHRHPRR